MRYDPLVDPVAVLDDRDRARYARHLTLPEIGEIGQRRLKSARVLVVGAGGLGSPALLYLAAAGVGTIGIVDDDVVSASNLQRQVLHGTADIGRPKVDSAADALASLDPSVEVVRHQERLTAANALTLVQAYDLVVDGADNFATRHLVGDACVLAGRPHVWGSVLRFDGQVSVWWPGHGPCYRCVFPAPPPAGSVASCAVAGVMGAVCASVAALQVTEAIKVIVGAGEPLVGRIAIIDALGARTETIALQRNSQCAVCGDEPTITAPQAPEEEAGVATMAAREVSTWLASAQAPTLVDVREPDEVADVSIDGSVRIPLGELAARVEELPVGRSVVVHCASGMRSARAATLLTALGFDAHSLAGGIQAWIEAELPVRRGH